MVGCNPLSEDLGDSILVSPLPPGRPCALQSLAADDPVVSGVVGNNSPSLGGALGVSEATGILVAFDPVVWCWSIALSLSHSERRP